MATTILIPTPLRPYTDKKDAVDAEGRTVGELLADLTKRHAGLKAHLYTEEGRQLLQFLKKNPDFKGQPETAKELHKIGDYAKIQVLLYEELYQGLELNELHYEAARLQARLVDQFIKTRKGKLASELETADEVTPVPSVSGCQRRTI